MRVNKSTWAIITLGMFTGFACKTEAPAAVAIEEVSTPKLTQVTLEISGMT